MRINRFFLKFKLGSETIKISDKEIYHQIRDVLRLKPGETIVLFDSDSNEALAEIIGISKNNIEVKVIELRKNDRESKSETILYCSVLKGERFEAVVEKATEVGVKRIVPIICERTIKTGIKRERLEKIIKEAAEQSGRGTLPLLESVISFEQAIEKSDKNEFNLFFDPSGENISNLDKKFNTVGAWIGPEGGWTEKEIEAVKRKGFKILSLSKLTFRAETAAIIASYLLLL